MSYVKFPYQVVTDELSMPYIWTRLRFAKLAVDAWVLADTGAEINLLPYSVGLRLGLNWEDFREGPEISGTVSGQSRMVDLKVSVGSFQNIQLSFCWLENDSARLLFGHQDFFEHFVAYFDSRNQEFALFKNPEPS